MTSQHSDWLASLERSGLRADLPAIDFGSGKTIVWEVASHEIFGDFTEGVFDMEIKASPSVAAAVLATGVVTAGTPSGGVTPITIDLSDQGSITEPQDPPEADLVFTIRYQAPASEPEVVRGGLLPVRAGVTS